MSPEVRHRAAKSALSAFGGRTDTMVFRWSVAAGIRSTPALSAMPSAIAAHLNLRHFCDERDAGANETSVRAKRRHVRAEDVCGRTFREKQARSEPHAGKAIARLHGAGTQAGQRNLGSSSTSMGGASSRRSSASRRATRSSVGGWERSREGCGMRRPGHRQHQVLPEAALVALELGQRRGQPAGSPVSSAPSRSASYSRVRESPSCSRLPMVGAR